jgi:hypothetical protein
VSAVLALSKEGPPWSHLPVLLSSTSWTSSRQQEHQWVPLRVFLQSALGCTRQMLLLCRVPRPHHSTKKLYRFPGVPSLPSDMVMTLDKVSRQSDQNTPFYLFLLSHPNKQNIYHIIITYTSQSSQNHHIRQTHDIVHKYHMFLHKVTSITK